MKRCIKCLKNKNVLKYGRQSRAKDKLMTICKVCINGVNRLSYERNRVSISIQQKMWKEKNRDKWNRYMRKYNKTENAKLRRRLWMNANKELMSERWKVRQAIKQADGEGFNLTVWRDICDRYDNRCICCGKKETTVDHILPVTKGGKTEPDNIQPLCRSCNSFKGTRTIDYR